MTETQALIMADRARKHRALLHNQPCNSEHTTSESQLARDTRIEESELILWKLLVQFGKIKPDEEIEEIAAITPDELAGWGDLNKPYLSITTNLQTIELPYES